MDDLMTRIIAALDRAELIALAGLAVVVLISGVQILCIVLASRARRRRRRAEWFRERPYQIARLAHAKEEAAQRYLAHIEQLRQEGLLSDDQAEHLAASAQRTIGYVWTDPRTGKETHLWPLNDVTVAQADSETDGPDPHAAAAG